MATPDGSSAKADVVFDGGMPQHGHGLPTVPKVIGRQDANGRAIVGGVRFNMPGWWELKCRSTAPRARTPPPSTSRSAMRGIIGIASAATLASRVFAVAQVVTGSQPAGWNDAQRQRIASLSLSALPPLPADPSNAVADDPTAAALGKALFFDTRLSANGKVACATCHAPDKQFQDGTSVGHGIGTGSRRTMPIAGTAYSPWMFWDGRADSQWAQALGPLENPVEHGSSRQAVTQVVAEHYAAYYQAVFHALPQSQPVQTAPSPMPARPSPPSSVPCCPDGRALTTMPTPSPAARPAAP